MLWVLGASKTHLLHAAQFIISHCCSLRCWLSQTFKTHYKDLTAEQQNQVKHRHKELVDADPSR